MTKDQLYQKIQALFPSTLAVGDVFKGEKAEFELVKITKKGQPLFYHEHAGYVGQVDLDDLKLIRKNITGEDILKMFNSVRKLHTHLELNNKGYLTYWESSYDDRTKQEDWILGKPLYDQSIDLIKLVWEVLNAK